MPYIKVPKPAKDKIRKRKFNSLIPRNCKYVDYKNVELLSRFINGQGKIIAAKQSGLSANQQRALTIAIKRARFMALMPYTIERARKNF